MCDGCSGNCCQGRKCSCSGASPESKDATAVKTVTLLMFVAFAIVLVVAMLNA